MSLTNCSRMKSSVQVLKSNARYFALLCGDNLVPLRAVCEKTDLSQTQTKISLTYQWLLVLFQLSIVPWVSCDEMWPNYGHPFYCDLTFQYKTIGHLRLYTTIIHDFLSGTWSKNVIITHLLSMHLVQQMEILSGIETTYVIQNTCDLLWCLHGIFLFVPYFFSNEYHAHGMTSITHNIHLIASR